MALQTWKQLGDAADIEDCRMESVLSMGRLCRRLQPKFESQGLLLEGQNAEETCMLCGRDQSETEYMVHGMKVGDRTGRICRECVSIYSAYLSLKAHAAGI